MELQIVVRLASRKILDNTICNSPFIRSCFLIRAFARIKVLELEAKGSYLQNMIPRNKKIIKIINSHLSKGQFLEEHNRLSPINLGATVSLLSRFRIEKTALFKDNSWSIEKLRRPFIFWLTSLTSEEKEKINKQA